MGLMNDFFNDENKSEGVIGVVEWNPFKNLVHFHSSPHSFTGVILSPSFSEKVTKIFPRHRIELGENKSV